MAAGQSLFNKLHAGAPAGAKYGDFLFLACLSSWLLFSGAWLLLNRRYHLHWRILRQIVNAALLNFAQPVFVNVRTLVRT
ncbi:MAG: hypothetical protein A2Z49_06330 [Chloroflexi bacterium RBG_19FT_COMBO_56_12]|nr:MAG: hypothetical protein A2Z49_06330 [Chloroflexi bacterium RBG_19FT_COMBO_56_12]